MLPPSSIAHYKLGSKLGEGGMGAVYCATDTKLNREVAIKVLPGHLASDAERLARFGREAQVLASLNHPNIASIYGLEDSSGTPALVMELVEGPTLAERISRGRLPVEEALSIARQICLALESAHAKNIVHRDLKPANVKVTPEGDVKVLDFGLAKALEEEQSVAATASASMSPTMTAASTRAGMILGTAAYMSPEQARGIPVDQRADIWAFGVVLLEMLTGRMAFQGETVADTLASVLKHDPDFNLLPADTPPRIRLLLRRCLERDRKLRLHHIADARIEIDATEEPVPALAQPQTRRSILSWIVGAALLPLAVAAGWWLRPKPQIPVLPAHFILDPPTGGRFTTTGHFISPDGRILVTRVSDLNANLYLREISSTSYRAWGFMNSDVLGWSPDGKSVLFSQNDNLYRRDISGGPPTLVGLHQGEFASGFRGATWNAKGLILTGTFRGPIYKVAESGGKLVSLGDLDRKSGEFGHWFPQFLPDGRYFVYAADGSRSAAYIGDSEGKEPPQRLFDLDMSHVILAVASDSDIGMLLFMRGGGLVGVRFDVRTRKVLSEAIAIAPVVGRSATGRIAAWVSTPARVLVYNDVNASDEVENLVLADRSGKSLTKLGGGDDGYGHLEFSPDGRVLTTSRNSGSGANELWAIDLIRGSQSKITSDGYGGKAQAWFPDGKQLAFMVVAGEKRGLYRTKADGSGKSEQLLDTTGHHIAMSPDGKYIAFEHRPELRLYSFDKPGTSEVLIGGPAEFTWPQFSPNGRWLSYISNETGRSEAYIQSFPLGHGKWQVSRDGARLARWGKDGKELVFVSGASNARFSSAAIRDKGDSLEIAAPVDLFTASLSGRAGGAYFALSPDGKQLAFNLRKGSSVAGNLHVLLDWMPK